MWRQKGQDMIEYALMLALVVGIGGFIYTQGQTGIMRITWETC